MIWNSCPNPWNFFTSSVCIITGSLGIAYLIQKRRVSTQKTMVLMSKRNLMTGLGTLLGVGTSCLTIYRWNLPQIVTIPMGIMIGQSLTLWGSLSPAHRVSFQKGDFFQTRDFFQNRSRDAKLRMVLETQTMVFIHA